MEAGNDKKAKFLLAVAFALIIGLNIIAVWQIMALQTIVEKLSDTVATPTTKEQPKTTETAGWKTYRNEEYGFEFRYPLFGNDQRVKEKDDSSGSRIYIEYTSTRSQDFLTTFGFFVTENEDKLGLKEWFSKYIDINDALFKKGNFKLKAVLGGGEMYIISYENLPLAEEYLDADGGPVDDAYLMSPSKNYVITFGRSQDHDLDLFGYGTSEEQRDLILEILSTFKFIPPHKSQPLLPVTTTADELTPEAAAKILPLRAPAIVETLCTTSGEKKFVTEDGYQTIFRGPAIYAFYGGSIWKISEGPITESADFFFDVTGKLIDVCQPLFRPSGCARIV